MSTAVASEYITGLTSGGDSWVPEFVMDINQKSCIGCGRCYKVCPRDVFDLVERECDDCDDDDDDGFSDDVAMVMSLKNRADCIGCGACSRVCPNNCFTHRPQAPGREAG